MNKAPKHKNNQSARRATRRLIAACAIEGYIAKPVKVQLSDAVEKTIRMDLPSWLMTSVANYDCLAQTVAE